MTMSPPRAFTSGELASRVGATLTGPADVTITGLAGIEDARPGDLTFVSDGEYAARWGESNAVAAVVAAGVQVARDARPLLVVPSVDHAMITLLEAFQIPDDAPEVGMHASAVVHPSARIGPMTRIGAQVWIGPEVVLGSGVILHPGVRLYRGVQVGDGSTLHANTVVRERCVIGRGVILHQNVSIGADGFGYRPAPDGRGLLKMPHIGTVRIDDGVEIGANSCVDRAKFGVTLVGAGTKIDNLCQIGHNCRIGRACVIAGNAGLGGSVTLGDGVVVGGGGGVREHLTIGSGARIGALTLVTKNVPPRAAWLGIPADDAQATLRQWACVRRLPSLLRQLTSEGVAAGRSAANAPDGG